ncbi:hypothetical protein NDR87_18660 [Nocardia sp. CDC159]|uniref:Pyrrolidone-carboxylate peptidase n=1 Tax=Nocardia pulmonis TaxID=2951408 RepID=A0A9X2E7P4_9NOCA|nr:MULTISPECIES: hypothetical protein [Nocardia]MCM6775637.1 hypothetical protein [Nocardia pulmonis]MCM6788387.1 hypothetical protein [Nocardia sp. CDC159]
MLSKIPARVSAVVVPLIAMAVLAGPVVAVPTGSAGGGDDGAGLEWMPTAECVQRSVPLGPEESRLRRPEAAELIEGGGFDRLVRSFVAELCAAQDYPSALEGATAAAGRLWRHAVDRAQGRTPSGALSASDDRPLYWARLAEVASIQQWTPSFALSPSQRADLVATIDRVGRGQDAIAYSTHRPAARRVLVTGFDPFKLDTDLRNGNPSGAAALALDGRVIETEYGRLEFAAAIFPVRWRDFGAGMVERALRPWLADGPDRVDLFATVSVGGPGKFDLEQTNGAWRGGKVDNESACYLGQIPNTAAAAGTEPQWTRSTLPLPEMAAAVPGPFPVNVRTTTDIAPPFFPPLPVITHCGLPNLPAVPTPDGPPPDAIARAGGGGTYLSNEIAYRATLLRDVSGSAIPGGHIHVPILEGLPEFGLTGPEFDGNRDAIIAQLTDLLVAAAGSSRAG